MNMAHTNQGNHRQQELQNTMKIGKCKNFHRPLWVIFSGLGCQWPKVGKDIMPVSPFAESIKRSKLTLKNLGVNLDVLLKVNATTIFDNVHHAVMAATSKIDGCVGNSHGELLRAYADGFLTAGETLLYMLTPEAELSLMHGGHGRRWPVSIRSNATVTCRCSTRLLADYAAEIIPDYENRVRNTRWVSTLFSKNSS